ncbi:MAG: hypothetical protein E3J71_03675 [Candidatus Stahlbacteria bacterium]|nr:MAG: hypothetical protein E3J71_03675 [Candidatus Stahlbacteria bacterium]
MDARTQGLREPKTQGRRRRIYEAAFLQTSKTPHSLWRYRGSDCIVHGARVLHDLSVPYAGVSGLALFGGSLELKEA